MKPLQGQRSAEEAALILRRRGRVGNKPSLDTITLVSAAQPGGSSVEVSHFWFRQLPKPMDVRRTYERLLCPCPSKHACVYTHSHTPDQLDCLIVQSMAQDQCSQSVSLLKPEMDATDFYTISGSGTVKGFNASTISWSVEVHSTTYIQSYTHPSHSLIIHTLSHVYIHLNESNSTSAWHSLRTNSELSLDNPHSLLSLSAFPPPYPILIV